MDALCIQSISSICEKQKDNTDTDRKSTRLNSSHLVISYAVCCFKKNLAHSCTYLKGRRPLNIKTLRFSPSGQTSIPQRQLPTVTAPSCVSWLTWSAS